MTRRLGAAIGALALIHVGLCWYTFPAAVVLGAGPIGLPDHQTHFHHVTVLIELYEKSGRLWGYDPGMLAGYPVGLFFDVDNKACFWWVLGLTRLGVPLAAAYNLFSVASSLLAPLSMAWAARLLQYSPAAVAAAAGLGSALWFFDGTLRFFWSGGMVSFATASHLVVVVVALMARMLAGERPWRYFWGLVALLPLALLVHAWAFVALVVPLTGLYGRAARRGGLGALGHVRVWAAAAAGLVVNWYWLGPALARLSWLTPSSEVGQATPRHLLGDLVEVLVSPVDTGFTEPRTTLRALVVVMAVWMIVRWRRAGDRRAAAAGLTMGWLWGLTYLGSLLPLIAMTEPYRFAAPATLAAGLFAAPWLVDWERGLGAALRAIPREARAAVALLGLVALPQAARTVLSTVPELAAPLRKEVVLDASGAATASAPPTMRLPALPKEWPTIARWLDEAPGEGRVLVGIWPLGEYLAGAGRRGVIGGFPDRRSIHEAANIFRMRPEEPRGRGDAFSRYLEDYAIEYVVLAPPALSAIEQRRDLLEIARAVGPYRIYKVRRPVSLVARGSGEVRAGLNTIAVTDARPEAGSEAMVLRFHFMESLVCAPACSLSREPLALDPAGFIRVSGAPRLPARFVIEQQYDGSARRE
ncbi:MAG: hypothetical protein IPK80_05005 [Nannocystis sp.]|nr:hypothetical protein [Nannocystis sp.]